MQSALLTAAVTSALASVLCPAARGAPFGPTGLGGGGFQNVLLQDGNFLLSGGDVQGFHSSSDNGQTWVPSNLGLFQNSQSGVADLKFDPGNHNTIFAALGQKGGGGLFESTNHGSSWTNISANQSSVSFSGDNVNDATTGLPNTHPRSTGNLIVATDVGASTFLYAGTWNNGLWRTTNNGANWAQIGAGVLPLGAGYVRSVIADPSDANTIWVGTKDGLFKTTNALSTVATNVTLTALVNPLVPSNFHVEEMLRLGTNLYVAGGSNGVYRYDGTAWSQIQAPTASTGTNPTNVEEFQSLAGYRTAAGAEVVYAGAGGLDSNLPDPTRAIIRTADASVAAPSWTNLAQISASKTTVGGPNGPAYWLNAPSNLPGGPGYVTSQLIVNPGSNIASDTFWSAGRGGIWSSTNGGTTLYPMMNGLGVTVNLAVGVDPNDASRVYSPLLDWTFISSTNRLQSVVQNKPPMAPGAVGYAVAFDRATGAAGPSNVYLASGDQSTNTRGEVSVYNPTTGSWTSQLLGTADLGKKPIALAVSRDVSNNAVVTAAVQNSGIWQKTGSANWLQLLSISNLGSPMGSFSPQASLINLAGTSIQYLDDPATGVWRGNAGSWRQIWSRTESGTTALDYLSYNPNDPGILYVTNASGFYQLSGITDTSTVGGTGSNSISTALLLAGTSNPGPLTLGPAPDGSTALFLAVDPTASTPAELLMYPISGSTLGTPSDIADNYYRSTVIRSNGLSVGPDGAIYLASNDGVIATTVPEPAALSVCGAVLLLATRRKRRRRH